MRQPRLEDVGLSRRSEGKGYSKKTLLVWAVLVSPPQAQFRRSFCAAFFKKRPFSLT
jgi:hypothetical protein